MGAAGDRSGAGPSGDAQRAYETKGEAEAEIRVDDERLYVVMRCRDESRPEKIV